MEKKNVIKLVAFAIVTALSVTLGLIEPFPGLEKTGMIFLGIFIWWVMMMIVELIPNALSCVLALVLSVAFGCGTTAEAFGSFSGATVWLLIGAFGLATALANSGLLNRLAINVMRLFPGTYAGQVWGLSLASVVCVPAVPSTTAKCTILIPLACMVGEKMGYAPKSKGMTGLFSVTNMITNFGGCMFLTGGVVVGIILALTPDPVSWLDWLKIFGLWGVIVVVLGALFSLFFYKPAPGEGKKLDKAEIKAMADDLGPMTKKEIAALVILIVAVAAWMTESMHGVPTYAVALLSWIAMTACGLFSPADFMSKILWPIVIMVGGTLGLIGLLGTTGVGTWISGLVAPAVLIFADTPVVLLLIICVVTTLLMFGLVQGPVSSAVFVTLLAAAPVSPLIIAFVTSMAAMVYILPFQLPTVMAAEGIAEGRVDHKDVMPSAWAYILINMVAVVASVPWWTALGLIG